MKGNAEEGLPREEWLAQNGFFPDPFQAEARHAEGDDLLQQDEVFVNFPYGSEVIGSIDKPGPRFVFANRGCGKTALRLTIQHKFNENLTKREGSPVLAVSYDDFDTVLTNAGNDPSKVYPRDHIDQIISLILEKLFEILTTDSSEPAGSFKKKLENAETRKLLLWYLGVFGALYPWQLDRLIAKVDGLRSVLSSETAVEFAKSAVNWAGETLAPSSISKLIGKAVEVINLPKPGELDKGKTSIKRQLEDILLVCQQFGFAGIYILVDDVDEPQYYGDNKDFDPAFHLIRSLASATKVLGIPGIVFKFFLPEEIRGQCLRSLRLDVYGERRIVWNRESLRQLLNQRLSACWKKDERRSKFSLVELCDDNDIELKYIDDMLIDFAEEKRSPRSLIYLGNELLTEHFRNGLHKPDDKINMETWNRARQRAEEVLT